MRDSLAAYLFDSAVVAFGTVMENALLEMVESGSGQTLRHRPRYTLAQLLDPAFILPRPGWGDGGPLPSATSDGGLVMDEVSA